MSEAERLAERDELSEALERYEGSILTRPSWPKSQEDEAPELLEVRAKLKDKLSERLSDLLAQGAWREACALRRGERALNRLTRGSNSSHNAELASATKGELNASTEGQDQPTSPALQTPQRRGAFFERLSQELWRAFERRLAQRERWRELPPLLEVMREGCAELPASPEVSSQKPYTPLRFAQASAQLSLLVSLTLTQQSDALESLTDELSLEGGALTARDHRRAALLLSLDELWRALSPLRALLPELIETIEGSLIKLREPLWVTAFDEATRVKQWGLRWLYAQLLLRPRRAQESAHLAQDTALFKVLTRSSVELREALKPLEGLSGAVSVERGPQLKHDLKAEVSRAGVVSERARYELSLHVRRVDSACERTEELTSSEVRLIDHYEERPTPDWVAAIERVEDAQASAEALLANLEQLKSLLNDTEDPLVRERLQREVTRSEREALEASERLERLTLEAQALPQSTRAPVYVLFRFPSAQWTLSCEERWALSLYEQRGEGLEPVLLDTTLLTARSESVDEAHRAYPQHKVKADPLVFPQGQAELSAHNQASLRSSLQSWLNEQLERVRLAAYRFTQKAEERTEERLEERREERREERLEERLEGALSSEQLNTLAVLAFTEPHLERAEALRRVLWLRLGDDPWVGEVSLWRLALPSVTPLALEAP